MTSQQSTMTQDLPLDPFCELIVAPHLLDLHTNLQRLISKVPEPKTRTDLYYFVFEIRRLLNRHEHSAWLLHPVDETSKDHYIISRRCACDIGDRLSIDLVDVDVWPRTTIDMLNLLTLKRPKYTNSLFEAQCQFPCRAKHETWLVYKQRVVKWVIVFVPDAYTDPTRAKDVSVFLWLTHRANYDMQIKRDSFESLYPNVQRISEVFSWFHENFPHALSTQSQPPRNNSGFQRSKKDNRRRDQSGRQRRRQATSNSKSNGSTGDVNLHTM